MKNGGLRAAVLFVPRMGTQISLEAGRGGDIKQFRG